MEEQAQAADVGDPATGPDPAVGPGTEQTAGLRSIVVSMPARQYADAARRQVQARPLTAATAAFLAGFAVAVLTRSR